MTIDMRQLVETYDRGRLVPFIGTGMSMPATTDWLGFVRRLAEASGLEAALLNDRKPERLVQVADSAVTALRCRGPGEVLNAHLRGAVYNDGSGIDKGMGMPPQTKALAQLHWPLLCTTNYDDVYLRAKAGYKQFNGKNLPEVRGRGDQDCQRVLQQQRYPIGEVIWAVQGMLPPRSDSNGENQLKVPGNLEQQIVVGHAEYRRVTHREPWFRRAFAEIFRRSSLLFLGTSLADPYFLALFDEIVELTGQPDRPHFAVVPKGTDVDRLRRGYGISCETYPSGRESEVIDFLHNLAAQVSHLRPRMTAWSYCVTAPS